MVAIQEVEDTTTPTPSQERLSDAEEIEKLIPQLKRPTAKMQLESLVKKLKKESSALEAIEKSSDPAAKPTPAEPPAPVVPPKMIATPIVSSSSAPSVTYTTIDKFAFDAGSSSDKFVTLYLPIPEIGSKIPKAERKERIKCDFGETSFDVTVMDLNGKNYRVKRDNLEHSIVPDNSKYVVKADKLIVKLAKKKGEYGSFDYWTKLTDPKKSEKSGGGKKKDDSSDPSASIMNMMKDLYDSGDDKMKKMIGETMLKQRNGELNKPPGMMDKDDDFGLGSDDGLGDLDKFKDM